MGTNQDQGCYLLYIKYKYYVPVCPLIIGKSIGNFYYLSFSTTQSIPPPPAYHIKAVYLELG